MVQNIKVASLGTLLLISSSAFGNPLGNHNNSVNDNSAAQRVHRANGVSTSLEVGEIKDEFTTGDTKVVTEQEDQVIAAKSQFKLTDRLVLGLDTELVARKMSSSVSNGLVVDSEVKSQIHELSPFAAFQLSDKVSVAYRLNHFVSKADYDGAKTETYNLHNASINYRDDKLDLGFILEGSLEDSFSPFTVQAHGLYQLMDNVALGSKVFSQRFGDGDGWENYSLLTIVGAGDFELDAMLTYDPGTLREGKRYTMRVGGTYPVADQLKLGSFVAFQHTEFDNDARERAAHQLNLSLDYSF